MRRGVPGSDRRDRPAPPQERPGQWPGTARRGRGLPGAPCPRGRSPACRPDPLAASRRPAPRSAWCGSPWSASRGRSSTGAGCTGATRKAATGARSAGPRTPRTAAAAPRTPPARRAGRRSRRRPAHEPVRGVPALWPEVHLHVVFEKGPDLLHRGEPFGLQRHDHPPNDRPDSALQAHLALDNSESHLRCSESR